MDNWLSLLLARDPRAMTAILAASILLFHLAATNLAWRWESLPARHWPRPMVTLARAIYELLRVGFYIGPLYFALDVGWIDLRAVGLGPLGTSGLDWVNGLAWTVILGLGAWGLLMLVWTPYLRATASLSEHYTPDEWASGPRRVLEVILMQGHWAFYRGVGTLLLGDLYAGAMSALGMVMLEAWSDPKVRRFISNVGQVESGTWSASLAIVSTISYLLTLNLWLVVLLHLVLEFTVPHLRLRPFGAEAPSGHPVVSEAPQVPPLPPARALPDPAFKKK